MPHLKKALLRQTNTVKRGNGKLKKRIIQKTIYKKRG